jgi:hypothetical protein
MSRKSARYAEALDDLDRLHEQGRISDARYEMHRSKLMHEVTHGTAGPVARLSTWMFVALAVAIVVLLLASLAAWLL